MPVFVHEHLRPLLGSAVLHLLLLVALAATALRWAASPPPVPLAIQGEIVQFKDLPPSLRAGRTVTEAPPVPKPVPKPEPKPELKAEPTPDTQAAARAKAAKAAKAAEAQHRAEQERALEAKREATEAEAKRKAAATEARQQQEAKEKAAREAKEAAAREVKLKAAREAELKRALASEEAGAAIAQSGVMDEYRALLVQVIERSWIRPPSARAGLECTLYVTQATGGTVVDVKLGPCNGDQAVRESITNAVYRSSPLPAPRDPRAFERRLVIVFKPTE